MFIIIILLTSVVCAVIAEEVASRRGRPALAYGFLGFLLGPLGLIIAIMMPPDEDALDQRRVHQGQAGRCPACREIIRRDARVCRHCHHHLTDAEMTENISVSKHAADLYGHKRKVQMWVIIIGAAVIVLACIAALSATIDSG